MNFNLFSRFFKKPDRMIALDVELDGMHPNHVIQLSYLIIDGRRIKGKNMYFKTRAVNRYAKKVHGLSVSDLKRLSNGETFADRAKEVLEDFSTCTLVIGHDVGGDIKALRNEFNRIGMSFPNYPIFCTLKQYTKEANIPLKSNPSVIKPPKLTELTEHFGLTQEFVASKTTKWFGAGDHPHDARYDATAAYLCMLIGERMA